MGSVMSKSNATIKDIRTSSFVQLKKVWRSSNSTAMSYQYYCMVQNVGGLPKQTAKDCQLRFHTSCLRKICRIYWTQKITNKELYQRTGLRDITTVIMQRRWRWLGNVIRKDRDSIARTALRWTLDSGRRKRDRPGET